VQLHHGHSPGCRLAASWVVDMQFKIPRSVKLQTLLCAATASYAQAQHQGVPPVATQKRATNFQQSSAIFCDRHSGVPCACSRGSAGTQLVLGVNHPRDTPGVSLQLIAFSLMPGALSSHAKHNGTAMVIWGLALVHRAALRRYPELVSVSLVGADLRKRRLVLVRVTLAGAGQRRCQFSAGQRGAAQCCLARRPVQL
jgi:hypothetical protein